jgi:hypothetical protein
MATIKVALDSETYAALMDDAARHLRPADWHAKAILRTALGLRFPYPKDEEHRQVVGVTEAVQVGK